VRRTDLRPLYFGICAVALGMCAGGLTAGGIKGLMMRLHPSPGLMLSRVDLGAWIHAIIGLSSLAAGLAAAWFHCSTAKHFQFQRLGGVYGFLVAFAWCIAMTAALWRLAVLVWPLFSSDILLITLAGVLGHRMSRRARA